MLGHVLSRDDLRGECLSAENGQYLPMRSGKSKDWKIQVCLGVRVNKKAIKKPRMAKKSWFYCRRGTHLKIWVIVRKVYIFIFRYLKKEGIVMQQHFLRTVMGFELYF